MSDQSPHEPPSPRKTAQDYADELAAAEQDQAARLTGPSETAGSSDEADPPEDLYGRGDVERSLEGATIYTREQVERAYRQGRIDEVTERRSGQRGCLAMLAVVAFAWLTATVLAGAAAHGLIWLWDLGWNLIA